MNEDIEKSCQKLFHAVGELGVKKRELSNPLSIVENQFDSMLRAYNCITDDKLLDLLRNEIDPFMGRKLVLGMCKSTIFKRIISEKQLSIFQIGKEKNNSINLSYSKDGTISATMYFPLTVGFISRSSGKIYVLDELKQRFCRKNNLCQKDSCNSCFNFVCNIDGKDILRVIRE